MFFILKNEMCKDYKLSIMFTKSLWFDKGAHFVNIVYSRIVGYGVYILSATLFIVSKDIIDIVL